MTPEIQEDLASGDGEIGRGDVYKRVVRLSSKFKAHDEENSAKVGDTVRIEESRPLSRDKRWRVVEIVARGSGVELEV